MTRARRLGALAAVVALVSVLPAAPLSAQQYPPGRIDVACDTTTGAPGSQVRCTVSRGTFRPGSSVTVDVHVSIDGEEFAAGPGLAVIGPALLARDEGRSVRTITEQVTADEEGRATVAFAVPDNAVSGPVDVFFSGTAPDGSEQTVIENAVFRVDASPFASGSVLVPEGGSSGWIPLAGVLMLAGVGIVLASRRRRGGAESGRPSVPGAGAAAT